MLSDVEKELVRNAVVDSLDRAEASWEVNGKHFIVKASEIVLDGIGLEERKEDSKIPGHPFVNDGIPKVDEFIALVVDMRNSTDHINSLMKNKKIENGFQRIYYETSALLPAISKTLSFKEGVVTEYLGDGALGLFRVDKEDRHKSIRQASVVARNCIEDMRLIVNQILSARYNLPDIHLGVGLSMGTAMVALVGDKDNYQPRAIGTCVWEATKLSGGYNTVIISKSLHEVWPTAKNGTISFVKTTMKDVDGFKMLNKN